MDRLDELDRQLAMLEARLMQRKRQASYLTREPRVLAPRLTNDLFGFGVQSSRGLQGPSRVLQKELNECLELLGVYARAS